MTAPTFRPTRIVMHLTEAAAKGAGYTDVADPWRGIRVHALPNPEVRAGQHVVTKCGRFNSRGVFRGYPERIPVCLECYPDGAVGQVGPIRAPKFYWDDLS